MAGSVGNGGAETDGLAGPYGALAVRASVLQGQGDGSLLLGAVANGADGLGGVPYDDPDADANPQMAVPAIGEQVVQDQVTARCRTCQRSRCRR